MKKLNFNKDWSFSLNGSEAIHVDLPHDFSIGRPRLENAPSGAAGGFFQGGLGRYEKKFTPKKNKKYFLMCDGSFGITEIQINQNLVYINKYGYNTFIADLSDYLRYGESNLITVTVNNKWQPNARWYTGSGIYRDVFLCECDRSYLDPRGIYVCTEQIVDTTAYLESEIRLFADKNGEGVVDFEIYKGNKRTPIHTFKRRLLAEYGENTFKAKFQLKSPDLWDTDAPNLYRIKATLSLNGYTDSEESVFGIRTLIADSSRGLLINGKAIKLLGGCIHHDGGPVGACSYAETEYRRIAKLKEAGFNAVRLSHNPQSQHLYDACDRLGMLVIDELFDYWTDGKQIDDMHVFFDDNYLKWTKEIVLRNRCHPSIIMWSTGNEIPQKSGRGYGYRYAKNIADEVRKHDHSRLLTHGFCGFFNHQEDLDKEKATLDYDAGVMDFFTDRIAIIADTVDVIGYNYLEYRYEKDLIRFPDKLFINTETFPLSAFTTYAQLKDNPRILGDFVWTAWDYFGETGIGHINYHYPEPTDLLADRFPNHISGCGDFDICGFRKPQSYLREIAWGHRTAPFIACTPPKRNIRPYSPSAWGFYDCIESWRFDGYEGQPTKIYVFADCDEVVLEINGEEIGRLERTENGIYIFDAIYEPGIVTARAYVSGKLYSKSTLTTEESPQYLSVTKEKSYLHKSTKKPDNDIVYVVIEAHDKNGALCPANESLIEVIPEGAELIGMANANPTDLTLYTSPKRNLYNGVAVAVFKKQSKDATITVTANEFAPVKINI